MKLSSSTCASAALAAVCLVFAACSNPPPPPPMDGGGDGAADGATDGPRSRPDVVIPDRQPGVRAPRTARCDTMDPSRCLLPWPSSTFLAADAATMTGVRVAVDRAALPGGDDPASINRADGFSRVTPIMTALPGNLDPASIGDLAQGAIRVLVAQPGPTLGEPVPVRFSTVRGRREGMDETLLIAYPRRPLAPATDHLVVVLDSVRRADGVALSASRDTLVALGRMEPETNDDAALYAYHAPSRALLARAGIDPAHVLRLWDFTTRSLATPIGDLTAMRAAAVGAVMAGTTTVAITTATAPASGPVALVVEGTLAGLPSFVADDTRAIRRGPDGAPLAMGTHAAPFRVALPRAGTGNYRIVMYGHGTGGSVHDSAFDEEITGAPAAKVGLQWNGWTEDTVIDTVTGFQTMLVGADRAVAGLLQSVADGAAIQRALAGALGDALAAPMVMGAANPVAGRRPDTSVPIWAGGSLGGTMGMVYSLAEPSIVAGVLNVPGAAWTHFMPYSNIFTLATLALRTNYRTDVDLHLALAMTQIAWDAVDGAAWAEPALPHRPTFLLQESMGDPVLPNIGTEAAATALSAVQVGVVLAPVPPLERADMAAMRAGLSQYRTNATEPLQVHGFAARNAPAGLAAREQIRAFIDSVWAGAPRITVPPGCQMNTPPNSCDFSARM